MDTSSDDEACTNNSSSSSILDLARWVWASKARTDRAFWFVAKLLMLVCVAVVVLHVATGTAGIISLLALGYTARRHRWRH